MTESTRLWSVDLVFDECQRCRPINFDLRGGSGLQGTPNYGTENDNGIAVFETGLAGLNVFPRAGKGRLRTLRRFNANQSPLGISTHGFRFRLADAKQMNESLNE